MAKPVAYRGSDPYAFVAYSHGDEKRIHEELDWMNRQGFNAYYDDGIHPGHRWREEIATAIDGACVFIFFITPRSVASADCLRELNYAIDQDRPVLAVHLEATELPSGVKLSINDRQAILAYAMSPTDYRLRLLNALGAYLAPGFASSARLEASEEEPKRPRWLLIYLPVPVLLLTLAALIVIGRWWDPFGSKAPDGEAGLGRAEALDVLREAEDLVNGDQYGSAYLLLRQIGTTLDDRPDLQQIKQDILIDVRPRITQDGAQVLFRPMQIGLSTDWIDVGVTPVESFQAPLGVLELRVEKSGFQTGHFVVANRGPMLRTHYPEDWQGPFPAIELAPDSGRNSGLVRIPAVENMPVILQGTSQEAWGGRPVTMESFDIARVEVTNQEYKTFVDAGGYGNAAYWSDLTFEDGSPFSLDEHRERLVDTTGRPSPAGWELGNYLPGMADHPVGGISWFEAMAYARFKNMSLPTVYHWAQAAQGPLEAAYPTVAVVAHLGNYNSAGARPASPTAIGPWGTYDMAGNVREWVLNPTSKGRLAMGGSWNDYQSNYFQAYSIRPLDRSPDNGMRLVDLPDLLENHLAGTVTLLIDSPRPFREPVTDEFFEGLRSQLIAARERPTNITVTTLEDSLERRVEEVTLEYESKHRLVLYAALPKPLPDSAQSVIYMPSGGAFLVGRTPNRDTVALFDYRLDFIVRSGRAAIIPIWDGSRERFRNLLSDRQHEATPAWYDDVSRTIEYIQSRPDLDGESIAFMGFSYGALFGPVILAAEHRLKTGVLISGGIWNNRDLHPMIDLINFAPRIEQPILLVNGEFDPIVPYGLSQKRLLELLPHPDNRQVLFDELGHWGFPRHRFYRAVVDWLDEQLGPVQARPKPTYNVALAAAVDELLSVHE